MATTALDLYSVLEDAGVLGLRDGTKELGGLCPQHEARVGKPDRHSSWSINKFTYVHHCFSCGYSGTLTGLLVDMLGYAPPDIEEQIAKTSFLRKVANLHQDHAADVAKDPPLTDWFIKNMLRDVPDRLLAFRRLQRHALDHYEVRWDPEKKCWVLPLRMPDGTLIGAQYRQKGSVLTMPKDVEKSQTLFGFTTVVKYETIALVESPLDAVRLFGVGIPAVSSLGAWTSDVQCRLLARTFGTVVLALDNDSAGHEGSVKAARSIRRYGAAVLPFKYSGLKNEHGKPAKDVGDVVSDEDIRLAWNRSLRLGM
jgi:hypothetical protein